MVNPSATASIYKGAMKIQYSSDFNFRFIVNVYYYNYFFLLRAINNCLAVASEDAGF